MGKASRKTKKALRELESLIEGLKISDSRVGNKREVRQRDRMLKLCFFCHLPGHVAKFCPARLARKQP